jgi:L-aspartate oxidase
VQFNRYLIRMDTRSLGHLYTDCLVIGGGVAGMVAALRAAQVGKVILLVKDGLEDSNTFYAQGGIAAVVGAEDSFDSHADDTLAAGCGLCDEAVVRLVVSRGPEHIEQLRNWKMPFDRDQGRYRAGREGGHSHSRVLHAHGDATGRGLVETLAEQIKTHPNIRVFSRCFAIDLITQDETCFGVVCAHPRHRLQCIWSRRTVLASGGAGRLYRETTNPSVATGDGLAMAYRAGAVLRDLEFIQFHPTTLYVAGATRVLVTEAIRGEGGLLLDRYHYRFMPDYSEMAELSPRDVVSRAIYEQMEKTAFSHVYLDVRHIKDFEQRFPTIARICQDFDIDVAKDLIPVRPSAHYMIGGVKTNMDGRTSIEHLYCCGEAASTGLHGANRLASNSLLEGMVFGHICGERIAEELSHHDPVMNFRVIVSEIEDSQRVPLDVADVTNALRALMTRRVGAARSGETLEESIATIAFWQRYVMDKVFDTPDGWQLQNMLTVSSLIAQSALARNESRGTHYRMDYPQIDDARFGQHIDIQR